MESTGLVYLRNKKNNFKVVDMTYNYCHSEITSQSQDETQSKSKGQVLLKKLIKRMNENNTS